MRRLVAAVLLGLLAGCAVGPDYRRPGVDVPGSFLYSDADARDTANAAWWRHFRDPVLDGLIDNALANNKNVKIAAANVEQAAAVLTRTRAPLFPQVGYAAEAERSRASESGSPLLYSYISNPQTSLSVYGSASWEIDLWGRIRRLSEAARADLLATEEARRGVILSLVAFVASEYLQLRGLDEQLVIARRTLETYRESVRLFELKFKHGQVSMMTVEQARTQYETAAAAIPQIESEIAQTENALSLLLGRNPCPIPRGRSIHEIALPAVPAAIPSRVLERRPDIARSEQNLVAANAQIGAARALYFPSISLTGAFGRASDELSDLFKGPSKTWSFGGSVTGPIFTAGTISGQVRQAEAYRKAALLSYESSIQSAFADVENSLVARMKIAEQLKAQERLVAAAGEYTRLAQLQYDGGYAPYTTVIQAQEQLFPAELNLAKYRSSLFTSYVRIYKALGAGWAEKPVNGGGIP
ncbi:MAG: efflux transporter outer membrane subunit [Deltaproteobacteria bacterium]|nr:efflux transporter outer membrane subunit [Deltaproteobacteria bacterium]